VYDWASFYIEPKSQLNGKKYLSEIHALFPFVCSMRFVSICTEIIECRTNSMKQAT
jgi:hypothetical protein